MQLTDLTELEIQKLRAETKGTKEVIHFNNAGSSLPPDVVVDSVVAYLQEEAVKGGYETEAKYQSVLNNTYTLIAKLINAEPDEIAIVENASTAWWIAFNGIDFKPGDEIIASEYEYVTNYIGLLTAQNRYGVIVKVIYNDEQGDYPIDKLEKAITTQTKLILATHIPSTAAGILPVAEIGKIARKNNILYLVDACQSVGQIPVDVKEIDCDMLAVTGRKYLRAPRGTGFLFVKKSIQNQLNTSLMDGFSASSVNINEYKLRDDARRFELYEKSRALTIGLGKAVEYALAVGIDRISQRIIYLADLMRNQLRNVNGLTVHDVGEKLCGIITFSVNSLDCIVVKNKLAIRNINISVGQAKSTMYYMEKNKLTTILRASVHYYNTEVEITLFCDAMKQILTEVESDRTDKSAVIIL
ncbi:MAG: aminotransferase class V-fold PLP-dependent enzyme [Sphingobacteriales bacterium]|nr:aminotransferase class V-fold PLP-dependent enzyme [Sphingobacteriales bacterium]